MSILICVESFALAGGAGGKKCWACPGLCVMHKPVQRIFMMRSKSSLQTSVGVKSTFGSNFARTYFDRQGISN